MHICKYLHVSLADKEEVTWIFKGIYTYSRIALF